MTPVDQTKFRPVVGYEDSGNCMQASVASILDLELDDVPHFVSFTHTNSWAILQGWLEQRGMVVVTFEQPLPDVLGLGTGKSPRGEFYHMAVIRNQDIVHDPHPSKAGFEGPIIDFNYLIKLDPAEPNEKETKNQKDENKGNTPE